MELRVLGEIEAHRDHKLALGGPRQRCILAALAIRHGQLMSVDRLVDVVWEGEEPPEQATTNVKTYVYRLRAALGEELADRIVTSAGGYTLHLAPDELDADHFERLVDQADAAGESGDSYAALAHCDDALALWRGDPYGEFTNQAWAEAEAARLVEIHVRAIERRATSLIELDRAAEAIGVLEPLIDAHPYREQPRHLLMTALYTSGRQAEALRSFQDFRSLLVEELGIDPSPELVDLEAQILAQEPLGIGQDLSRRVRAYELEEVLGEGSFAMVWRGSQPGLGRDVAVKQLHARLADSAQFIRHFETEAQMVAVLEHPHIVPLYDFWREPGAAYLVMRYLRGGTLESRLVDRPLAEGELIRLIEQVGGALELAHRRGVIHRDVKPANVFLDEESNFYLGDFGIASGLEYSTEAAAAISTGSPGYAAPEQLRRQAIDARTDIYAMGVTLFEAATGRLPFAEETTEAALVRRQLEDEIPAPSSVRPGAPQWLDDVVARATAKEPAQRFDSVGELLSVVVATANPPTTDQVSPRPAAYVSSERRNPFKALSAFTEADAVDFHGRDRLVARFVALLQQPGAAGRLVAAVGPSGSGKSSVIRAGLLPILRRGAVGGSEDWFLTTMMPGAQPFEELEAALTRISPSAPGPLVETMMTDVRGIGRATKQVLPDETSELVLLIDQFEELFTLVGDDAVRERFIEGLAAALKDPRSRLRVVVTIRADFWDRPLEHPTLAGLLDSASVMVPPLDPDELERAIVDPVLNQGMDYEPGLVARIAADVADQPGALPLLQYTLTQLFDTSVSGLLTAASYDELGGITGALAGRADEVYEQLDDDAREASRRMFGRLVTLGEGTEDTRRRVTIADLGSDPAMARSVDAFGKARLLTFDRHPTSSEPTVEVGHEAVIREWPRLRVWLAEDREDLRIQHHLTTSSAAWDEQGRDDGELYRGLRLGAADRWTEKAAPVLTAVEAQFLDASRQLRDDEEAAERARIRRLRRLVVLSAGIAVVAIAAGLFAFREQRRADDQAAQAEENATLASSSAEEAEANAGLADLRADEAEDAREQGDIERMRAVARANAAENPQLAAVLAVEAHRADPSLESLDTLHHVLTEIPAFRGAIASGSYDATELLADGVTLVAVGPDNVDVWDLENRELLRRIEHPHILGIPTVAVTADGRIAAVRGGLDQTIIYDLTTGSTLGMIVHDTAVNDLSLSPDGSRLAAARVDGRVGIWDTASETRETLLDTGPDPVEFAQWSPTEDRIAVATQLGQVQVWDPDGDDPIWTVDPPSGPGALTVRPNTLTFTPDGSMFVVDTATFNATTTVFDTIDGSQPFPVTERATIGAAIPIRSLVWVDPDELIIAVPNRQSMEAFDLKTGEASTLLPVIRDSRDVAFSEELDRIVSVGASGIRLWSADRSGPLERAIPFTKEQADAFAAHGGVLYTSLAPDGSSLIMSLIAFPATPPAMIVDLIEQDATPEVFVEGAAATSGFGEFTTLVTFEGSHLLDVDGEPLGPRIPFSFDHTDSAASVDGRFFAIARLGGFVDLYTGASEPIATLEMELTEVEQSFVGLSFTSDGSLIAATTFDDLVLWETETLERIELDRDESWGWTRLVGDELIVSANDGSLLRIDPRTGDPVAEPLIGGGGAGTYALDPVHGRLAALGDLARIWDLESGKQLGRGLPVLPIVMEFTADGSVLSVATEDRVTLWNYDTDSWADIACEYAGRNLSADEWEQFGPRTTERRATCPQYEIP